MKRKTLILTVIAAGLVIAATSAALGVYPSTWFASENSKSSRIEPVTLEAPLPSKTPALPASVQHN